MVLPQGGCGIGRGRGIAAAPTNRTVDVESLRLNAIDETFSGGRVDRRMSHFAGMVVSFMREHPGLATANMTAALVLAPIGDVLLPHLYGRLVTAVDSGGKGRSGLVIKARVLAPSLAVIGALALWQGGYIAKDVLDMLTEPRLVDFVRTRMVSSLIWKRMQRAKRVASNMSSPSRQVATPIR